METEQKPKRKRRTKAEIEASKLQAQTVVSAKSEDKAPEEYAVKPYQSPEQKVLLVSTKNSEVLSAIEEFAKSKGVALAFLSDEIVENYAKNSQDGGDIKEFMSKEANRQYAQDQATKLWIIMTADPSFQNSQTRVFTTAQVTHKVNLPHSKVKEILSFIKTYGFLEYVKGTHEFVLLFSPEDREAVVLRDIQARCSKLNYDISRYQALVKANTAYEEAEKKALYAKLGAFVDSSIEF